MLLIFLLLAILSSACGCKSIEDTLYYDLPEEAGFWVTISKVNKANYQSPYYLIEDSVYVGFISLSNETPIEFFLRSKLKHSHMVHPLTDVDIHSFEVNINKDNSPYARDKKSVYYPRGTIRGEGPVFFDSVNGGGELYYGDISIDGADPQTFQYIGSGYAKDINNVYFKGYEVPSADLPSFKVLGKDYAIDKTNMYYRGKKIKWNDNIISVLQQEDCPEILPVDYGMANNEK